MVENRFTVRIRPYTGESLYSFMLRFAEENGISILKLWNMIKKTRSHLVQLADAGVLNFVPINMIEPLKMAYMTGLAVEDIFGMSFYYLLKKFCGNSKIERSRFISEILRDTFNYCPKCLHESPYHRLLWSVKNVNICIKHRNPLINRCLHCNQEIMIKDLHGFRTCPYCGNELWENEIFTPLDTEEFKRQSWVYNTFDKLITNSDIKVEPNDMAIRILFILNKAQSIFDREVIQNSLNGREMLPTVLQHARESLSNKRTMHLSFILSVLYENNTSIDKFLNMKVPEDFIASIRNKTTLKKDEVCCIAPWCKNYMKKGMLVKTGTSFKRKNDGDVYKYYLICPECGCEYAFDENNELKERTHFIESYHLLNNFTKQELGLKRLSEKTGLSQEMVRRCLSYFQSRQVFTGEFNRKTYEVDELLLHKFIKAIKSDIRINEIKKWPIWESYNHFLFYRFHKDVIKELNTNACGKHIELKEAVNERQIFIKNTLERMLKQDSEITIKNVCKEAGVCAETLRYWGCNPLIAQIKDKQREEKILELKNRVHIMVDKYLLENSDDIITSDGMYSYIGIIRNVLWRYSPELTAYIGHTLNEHNKKLRNKN